MKRVYTASDPVNAHLVRELLEGNGIPAVVQDERIFAVRGSVPVVYPTVWVNEDGYEAARAVVEQFDAAAKQPAETASWICPACGERIDGQFTECWKCAGAAEAVSGATGERKRSRLYFLILIAVAAAVIALLLRKLVEKH